MFAREIRARRGSTQRTRLENETMKLSWTGPTACLVIYNMYMYIAIYVCLFVWAMVGWVTSPFFSF